MVRKKRRINEGLAKYINRRSYGYIYQPYLGMESGKRKYGKDVNLCPSSSTVAEANEALTRLLSVDTDTLRWLLTEYQKSDHVRSLKPSTRKDYEGYKKILLAYPMANGKEFGTAPLDKIKRTAIRKYLDKYPSPISANRQIQYLKAGWNWATQRHDHVPENPCNGVTLNKQARRTRYANQEEFQAFKQTTSAYIPMFMELAYLCRARWSEVASLKIVDLRDEGIFLKRLKGSDNEITKWTPRLRAAVAACRAFNPSAPSPISGAFLIHTSKGAAIKQNTFQTAWGRAMRDWAKNGGERYTFHDLKAAGYSDQDVQDAGHRSEKMHDVYNRKPRLVEPAE
jgi:integrase